MQHGSVFLRPPEENLPGKRFIPDADAEFCLAFFQDAGKLVQIRGVLFPDGRSEFRIKLSGEHNLFFTDLIYIHLLDDIRTRIFDLLKNRALYYTIQS